MSSALATLTFEISDTYSLTEIGDGAFSGSGSVNVGLVFSILAGALAIAALVLIIIYIYKKNNEKSPMLAYAVTLADIESGAVRLPGEPKGKRNAHTHKDQTSEAQTYAIDTNEENEKGEDEC